MTNDYYSEELCIFFIGSNLGFTQKLMYDIKAVSRNSKSL